MNTLATALYFTLFALDAGTFICQLVHACTHTLKRSLSLCERGEHVSISAERAAKVSTTKHCVDRNASDINFKHCLRSLCSLLSRAARKYFNRGVQINRAQ